MKKTLENTQDIRTMMYEYLSFLFELKEIVKPEHIKLLTESIDTIAGFLISY